MTWGKLARPRRRPATPRHRGITTLMQLRALVRRTWPDIQTEVIWWRTIRGTVIWASDEIRVQATTMRDAVVAAAAVVRDRARRKRARLK